MRRFGVETSASSESRSTSPQVAPIVRGGVPGAYQPLPEPRPFQQQFQPPQFQPQEFQPNLPRTQLSAEQFAAAAAIIAQMMVPLQLGADVEQRRVEQQQQQQQGHQHAAAPQGQQHFAAAPHVSGVALQGQSRSPGAAVSPQRAEGQAALQEAAPATKSSASTSPASKCNAAYTCPFCSKREIYGQRSNFKRHFEKCAEKHVTDEKALNELYAAAIRTCEPVDDTEGSAEVQVKVEAPAVKVEADVARPAAALPATRARSGHVRSRDGEALEPNVINDVERLDWIDATGNVWCPSDYWDARNAVPPGVKCKVHCWRVSPSTDRTKLRSGAFSRTPISVKTFGGVIRMVAREYSCGACHSRTTGFEELFELRKLTNATPTRRIYPLNDRSFVTWDFLASYVALDLMDVTLSKMATFNEAMQGWGVTEDTSDDRSRKIISKSIDAFVRTIAPHLPNPFACGDFPPVEMDRLFGSIAMDFTYKKVQTITMPLNSAEAKLMEAEATVAAPPADVEGEANADVEIMPGAEADVERRVDQSRGVTTMVGLVCSCWNGFILSHQVLPAAESNKNIAALFVHGSHIFQKEEMAALWPKVRKVYADNPARMSSVVTNILRPQGGGDAEEMRHHIDAFHFWRRLFRGVKQNHPARAAFYAEVRSISKANMGRAFDGIPALRNALNNLLQAFDEPLVRLTKLAVDKLSLENLNILRAVRSEVDGIRPDDTDAQAKRDVALSKVAHICAECGDLKDVDPLMSNSMRERINATLNNDTMMQYLVHDDGSAFDEGNTSCCEAANKAMKNFFANTTTLSYANYTAYLKLFVCLYNAKKLAAENNTQNFQVSSWIGEHVVRAFKPIGMYYVMCEQLVASELEMPHELMKLPWRKGARCTQEALHPAVVAMVDKAIDAGTKNPALVGDRTLFDFVKQSIQKDVCTDAALKKYLEQRVSQIINQLRLKPDEVVNIQRHRVATAVACRIREQDDDDDDDDSDDDDSDSDDCDDCDDDDSDSDTDSDDDDDEEEEEDSFAEIESADTVGRNKLLNVPLQRHLPTMRKEDIELELLFVDEECVTAITFRSIEEEWRCWTFLGYIHKDPVDGSFHGQTAQQLQDIEFTKQRRWSHRGLFARNHMGDVTKYTVDAVKVLWKPLAGKS